VIGLITAQLSGKLVELLKDAVPGLTRVALLGTPAAVSSHLPETRSAARSLGLGLQAIEAAVRRIAVVVS
jgi:hypothetical protein